MWKLSALLLTLTMQVSAAANNCTAALNSTEHRGVTLKLIQKNIQIANGWSFIQKFEILDAGTTAEPPLRQGDQIHVLFTHFLFLQAPEIGGVLTNVILRRSDFHPNFEPKIYYDLSESPEGAPFIANRKAWNALPVATREAVLGSAAEFWPAMGIRKTELENLDFKSMEQASSQHREVLMALKDALSEGLNMEVEPGETYSTVGRPMIHVSLLTLADGAVVSGEIAVRQEGAMREGGQFSHYESVAQARVDGADTDADVSWSASGEFLWDGRKLRRLKLGEYMEWSGH